MTPSNDRFYVGTDPRDRNKLLWLPLSERSVHWAVWGMSGKGKSYFLADQICQDIISGRGCVVIDPKGDLVEDILRALAGVPRETWARLAQDLIIVDPADPACTTVFNPLEVTPYASASRQRQELLAAFRKIWNLEDTQTPRLSWVLSRGTQLAMEHGLTLSDIQAILTDTEFRERLVDSSKDQALRTFWQHEFPKSEGARSQWVSSTLSRLEMLLDDASTRRLLCGGRSTFDFREALDAGRVILINLAKGRVGSEPGFLLGALLLAKLQMAAESRAAMPHESRRQAMVYVDEMQNYAGKSFEVLLTEARGYGVSVVMANQHVQQLDTSLQAAIFGNARLKAIFAVSHGDSIRLAPELWRHDGARVKETRWDTIRIGNFPIPVPEPAYYTASEERRMNQESLHHLPNRLFWFHIQGAPAPVLLRSVDVPRELLARNAERAAELRALVYEMHTRAQAALPPPSVALPRRTAGTFEWAGRDNDSTPAERQTPGA